MEILEDIHQLYENTATFNGAENELTLLAKQFVDDTEKYVEENIDVLAVFIVISIGFPKSRRTITTSRST